MNEKMKAKLDEILNKEFTFEDNSADESDLIEFENEYNITLPEAYREFVLENNYEYINDDYYFEVIERSSMTPKDGLDFMDSFYGLQDFLDNSEEFLDNWCDYVLPIGEVAGDYICIGIKKNNFGKIYMCNHEDEEREDGLYMISESFTDFIMSFRYVEQE